jgi:hypothetical protein
MPKQTSRNNTAGRISINRTGGERNIFTDKVTIRAETNTEAIISAMEYCQAAITELENMKLAPAMDPARIEGLKAAIPPIDQYREYQAEKPMTPPPVFIRPRFGGAASDEYDQTLLDRVHNKAKDFLSKPAGGR